MTRIIVLPDMSPASVTALQKRVYSAWAWQSLEDACPGDILFQYCEAREPFTAYGEEGGMHFTKGDVFLLADGPDPAMQMLCGQLDHSARSVTLAAWPDDRFDILHTVSFKR